MSLTGKQVRELQSLYESVYSEKPEKEDVVLTQEEFDQLCYVILQEAFESSGVEIFEGRKKLTLIQKGYRHIVKPAIDYIKKNKVQLGTSAAVGGAGVGEITTGGTNIKHGGAMLNNLGSFVKDTRTMSNQNQQGAGMLMKDKETGTFSTAQQVRDKVKKKEKLNNSFEFNNFNLHIVEDVKSLEDLTKELNKQKNNKKDNTNINTNIKDNTPKTETPKTETPKTETPKTETPKTETPKTETPKTETSKTETPKTETSKTETPKTETPKVDSSKVDTSKEIESDANYAKSNAKFNQRFKDANTDTSNEIESDANYAKSNLRFNRASKGLPPVKRPRVPSPMDMLNPGGVRVKARFKAREAQGLSGLTGKPKFEAYDVVLDYVLSEGHADTLDEAHYVMMQMDENTIQQIIEMSSPYTISQADVNAKTPAFKNYQKGVKNKITGEPLYKLGSGVNLPKI